MRKTLVALSTLGLMAIVVLCPLSAHANADDEALDLKVEGGEERGKVAQRSLRLFGELAGGRLYQRGGLASEDVRRASVDFYWEFKPAAQWRGVLSNRLDDMHPVDAGSRSTLNSLREAYLGWQREDGSLGADAGRLNLRYGPAYGFNPTDYFRDGSSRAVTSADPLALRENRLGTGMLRVQRLWNGGSLSLVVAPKLENAPSRESFGVDLGATNHANRVLVAASAQAGNKVSLQGFAFHEQGKGLQIGANATALLNDSAIGFFEWSGGRDFDLFSETFDPTANAVTRHRAVAGLTYTTASRLAVTFEFEYNGFALSKTEWQRANSALGVEAMGAYQYQVQKRQDIASRRALLLYLSQRDALIKNLELTGLIRLNADDNSRFAWAEARYHWPRFDVALQWQTNLGRATSEYGSLTGKRLVQLLGVFYF